MSAAVIPSLQAALVPPDPSHVPPITFGGHSATTTNQVDASQRANLVIVTLGMSCYYLARHYPSNAPQSVSL